MCDVHSDASNLFCSGEGKHFNVIDFEEMGKVLCEVALEYRETQENARSALLIVPCPSVTPMDGLLH